MLGMIHALMLISVGTARVRSRHARRSDDDTVSLDPGFVQLIRDALIFHVTHEDGCGRPFGDLYDRLLSGAVGQQPDVDPDLLALVQETVAFATWAVSRGAEFEAVYRARIVDLVFSGVPLILFTNGTLALETFTAAEFLALTAAARRLDDDGGAAAGDPDADAMDVDDDCAPSDADSESSEACDGTTCELCCGLQEAKAAWPTFAPRTPLEAIGVGAIQNISPDLA
jgi:hypothetical protein